MTTNPNPPRIDTIGIGRLAGGGRRVVDSDEDDIGDIALLRRPNPNDDDDDSKIDIADPMLNDLGYVRPGIVDVSVVGTNFVANVDADVDAQLRDPIPAPLPTAPIVVANPAPGECFAKCGFVFRLDETALPRRTQSRSRGTSGSCSQRGL